MATISDLKFQKNKKRVNVFLDGAYQCALQYETIVKAGLKVGDDVELDELEKIQFDSEINRAKEITLSLIEKKMYTTVELKRKLKEKGFLPNILDSVCESLSDYGYIDDKVFVKAYCLDNKKRSKKDLMFKLKTKGISEADIKEQLESIDPTEEKINCRFWAQKFLRVNSHKQNLKQKLVSHLGSKGFGFDTIRAVVDELMGGEGEYD